MTTIQLTWGRNKLMSYMIYLGLSFLFLGIFIHFFLKEDANNLTMKFTYSLMIIVSLLGTLVSLSNIIKVYKGASTILIEDNSVRVLNRSFMYKEDFEFSITNLHSLTLVSREVGKHYQTLKSSHHVYDLCVQLKDKKEPIRILPHIDRSVEELKMIADDLQKVIMQTRS